MAGNAGGPSTVIEADFTGARGGIVVVPVVRSFAGQTARVARRKAAQAAVVAERADIGYQIVVVMDRLANAGGAVKHSVLGGGVAAGAVVVGGTRALEALTAAQNAVESDGVEGVSHRTRGVALVVVDVVDVAGGGAVEEKVGQISELEGELVGGVAGEGHLGLVFVDADQ